MVERPQKSCHFGADANPGEQVNLIFAEKLSLYVHAYLICSKHLWLLCQQSFLWRKIKEPFVVRLNAKAQRCSPLFIG